MIYKIQNVFKTISNAIGNYEILISNAGVSTMNYVEDLSEEEWDFNMDVNAELCAKARKLGREFVIQIEGSVIERASKNKNFAL